MKFASILAITVAAMATTQASLIPDNLQGRFQQERNELESELQAWKNSTVGRLALDHGLVVVDALNTLLVHEDHLARLFLTKIGIEQAQKLNPDAEFSLYTPFSLLTDKEFAEYVHRGSVDLASLYASRNATATSSHPTRKLLPRTHYHKATATPKPTQSPTTAPAPATNEPPATTETPTTEPPATTETPTTEPPATTETPTTEPPATTEPATTEPPVSTTPTVTTTPPFTTTAPVTQAPNATTKDWTTGNCVGAIKSQGECGSCWAFSTIGALESAICLKHGNLPTLSEQELVSCDSKNHGCSYGSPVYAFSYIKNRGGVSTEDSYPYTSDQTNEAGQCYGGDKYPVSITAVNTVDGNDAALVAAINKQPVSVLVASGNSVWKQYKRGVVSACSSTEVDHCVVAVGYDETSFKIRNSWGTWWGESGYIRLKRISSTEAACSLINDWATYPSVA